MTILKDFIERLTLLREGQTALQQRGFTESVWNNYQLKSCHPINITALEQVREYYGLQACVEAGLYNPSELQSGLHHPQRQLLDDNILIPYLRADNSVVKIRPHKMGFRGQGALIYRTHSSFRSAEVCVIAESEFKAIAAECFGFAAIGIPGIASMSGKNWEYFAKELEGIDTKEFVICFDNEVKDNQDFRNFKPDWRKRYDTIIYAYAMAQKILNIGKSCKIATLPADWMEYGKVDIDLALAQGRTPAEFAACIKSAQGPKAYLNGAPVPQKHRGFLTRRTRRFFYNPQVEIKGNCFFTLGDLDEKGQKQDGHKITNCTFAIRNVYEELGTESEGVMRDIVITDEYGMESRPITVRADSICNKSAMKEWLMSKGNYLFYGQEQDLTKIWEHVFNTDDGNVVYMVNQCGYIKEFDFYLFKNVLIKGAQAIMPDEQGIFWLDDVGFKPAAIHEANPVPMLATEGKFDVKKFLKLLADTLDLDNPGMAKCLFAWVLSVLFIDDIQETFKLFPIFFMYGTRSSGKTTVMRWLTSFFGQDRASVSLGPSTTVGVTRGLAYYSSLPFVVDDWRNHRKFEHFIPLFLGVYNRQTGFKGVRKSFGLHTTAVRASLAVLGEEMFPDNALQSRCLSFYMPTVRRRECGEEIEDMIGDASAYTYTLLRKRTESQRAEVIKNVKKYAAQFKKDTPGLDARVAINYAILAGTYATILGEDEELMHYIYGAVREGFKAMTDGDKLHLFAEELMVAQESGDVTMTMYAFEGNKLFMWLKAINDTMNKYYHRQVPDQTPLLLQHLKRQLYFVKMMPKALRPDSSPVNCVCLDLTKMDEELRACFNRLRIGGQHGGDATEGSGEVPAATA